MSIVWYQRPSWVLTLLTKWDPVSCIDILHFKNLSPLMSPPPELHWDCGHVNCCTNVLHGCWFFWRNVILDIFHFNIDLSSPDFKYLIWVNDLGFWACWLCYQHPLWVLTHFTNVPSSFPLIFTVNALFYPASILFYRLVLLYLYTLRYFCMPLTM